MLSTVKFNVSFLLIYVHMYAYILGYSLVIVRCVNPKKHMDFKSKWAVQLMIGQDFWHQQLAQ